VVAVEAVDGADEGGAVGEGEGGPVMRRGVVNGELLGCGWGGRSWRCGVVVVVVVMMGVVRWCLCDVDGSVGEKRSDG
jgi:hypothetical protein